MKADTQEWVRYAEEDYVVACVLMRSRRPLAPNSVCFHCQQSIEKYLKARLVEAGMTVPKTHDLEALLNLLLPLEPLWETFRPTMNLLGGFAVKSRYPGHDLQREEARFALKTCRSLRKEARLALSLPAR